MEKLRLLRDRSSGYAASTNDWESFLECWHLEVSRKAGSGQVITVLSKYAHLSLEPQPSVSEVEAGLASVESHLGVSLPRSYKDFLRVYRPPKFRPYKAPGGESLGVGIYAVDQIGLLGKLNPELAQINNDIAIESSDVDYYIYGIGQNDVAMRTRYRQSSVVVGSHGHASHDLIVLYPQERTQDGEMEAALIFHSGEFRAPSFAELMRQLSYMETRAPKYVPPYSQKDLEGACANRLPIASTWWK